MQKNVPFNLRTKGLEAVLPVRSDDAFEFGMAFRKAAIAEGLTVPDPSDWRDPIVSVAYNTPAEDPHFKGKRIKLFLPALPIVPGEAVSTLFRTATAPGATESSYTTRRPVNTTLKLLGSIAQNFTEGLPDDLKTAEGNVRLDFVDLRDNRIHPTARGAINKMRIFELVPDAEQLIEVRYQYLQAIAKATGLNPRFPIERPKTDGKKFQPAGLAIGAIKHVSAKRQVALYRSAWQRLEGQLRDNVLPNGSRKLEFSPLLFSPVHNMHNK